MTLFFYRLNHFLALNKQKIEDEMVRILTTACTIAKLFTPMCSQAIKKIVACQFEQLGALFSLVVNQIVRQH